MRIIRKKLLKSILGSLCILLFLVSCSTYGLKTRSQYGTMEPSGKVTESFESYTVNDNLNYYISGSDVVPNAIMGIDKRYILVSDLWKKRDFTGAELGSLVENMRSMALEYGSIMHGFDIVDNRGNDIGDWYSILSARTAVKMDGEYRVIIHTPPLETYKTFRIKKRGIY